MDMPSEKSNYRVMMQLVIFTKTTNIFVRGWEKRGRVDIMLIFKKKKILTWGEERGKVRNGGRIW